MSHMKRRILTGKITDSPNFCSISCKHAFFFFLRKSEFYIILTLHLTFVVNSMVLPQEAIFGVIVADVIVWKLFVIEKQKTVALG